MAERVRNLRHPITVTIEGRACTLLTSGYVAHALNRTPWTIKHWQAIGLFPLAPFVIAPGDSSAKRSLFPESFVTSLKVIAKRSYYGARLDRADFQDFHDEVLTAYKETVMPLMRGGVGITHESRSPVGAVHRHQGERPPP